MPAKPDKDDAMECCVRLPVAATVKSVSDDLTRGRLDG